MNTERQSLLGAYPVTALHMVGGLPRPTPGLPSQWQPSPPPAQYGIDYTFLRHQAGRPIRWRPDLSITIRIAGPHLGSQVQTIGAVLAELAGLTGMILRADEPWPQAPALRAVPRQEIHVGFMPALPPAPPFAPCADQAGFGGALTFAGSNHYICGLAVVATGVVRPGSSRELAVLRHELAHALGLGHAARPSLLMHYRLAATITDYGRGDRRGLSLLRQASPAQPRPTSRPSSGRTNPCAA
jgi:hypothetical protein